jgi:hypothetical protein
MLLTPSTTESSHDMLMRRLQRRNCSCWVLVDFVTCHLLHAAWCCLQNFFNNPVLQLQCWRPQQQAATAAKLTEPCRLQVFYNTTYLTAPDPSTFGIDAGPLPVEGFEVPPNTADALNRTEWIQENGKPVQYVN